MVSSGVDSNKKVIPILVDSNGRPYIILDDGSGNTMPAMDIPQRRGYMTITDGAHTNYFEDDDGTISKEKYHLTVINLNYVRDGDVWVPMTQP